MWVKITDGNPENDRLVAVKYEANLGYRVGYVKNSDVDGFAIYENANQKGNFYSSHHASHWMYIPEVPQD